MSYKKQCGSRIRGPSLLLANYGILMFVFVLIFKCAVRYTQLKVLFGSGREHNRAEQVMSVPRSLKCTLLLCFSNRSVVFTSCSSEAWSNLHLCYPA